MFLNDIYYYCTFKFILNDYKKLKLLIMRKFLFLLILLGFVSQVNAQVICYVETPPLLVGNKEMSWAFGGGWGTPDLNVPGNSILDTLVFASDGTAADSLV